MLFVVSWGAELHSWRRDRALQACALSPYCLVLQALLACGCVTEDKALTFRVTPFPLVSLSRTRVYKETQGDLLSADEKWGESVTSLVAMFSTWGTQALLFTRLRRQENFANLTFSLLSRRKLNETLLISLSRTIVDSIMLFLVTLFLPSVWTHPLPLLLKISLSPAL